MLSRALSKLGAKALHTVLIRALDVLDDEAVRRVIGDMVDLDALRPARATGHGLLCEVQDFALRSLEGAYYEQGSWQVGANEEGLRLRLEFAHRRQG